MSQNEVPFQSHPITLHSLPLIDIKSKEIKDRMSDTPPPAASHPHSFTSAPPQIFIQICLLLLISSFRSSHPKVSTDSEQRCPIFACFILLVFSLLLLPLLLFFLSLSSAIPTPSPHSGAITDSPPSMSRSKQPSLGAVCASRDRSLQTAFRGENEWLPEAMST